MNQRSDVAASNRLIYLVKSANNKAGLVGEAQTLKGIAFEQTIDNIRQIASGLDGFAKRAVECVRRKGFFECVPAG